MARPLSRIAPAWWDFTTLDRELMNDAAALTVEGLQSLSRDGFRVVIHDTLPEFYLAEAMEYIHAWKQSTEDNPVGICGPIGPVDQLPLVAMLVNEMDLSIRSAHFWGMDEWVIDGQVVGEDHPLSFAATDMNLCFNRIRPDLVMPKANIHFPNADPSDYSASYEGVRCAVMQGGQGEVKHWAFNDPPKREAPYTDNPPPPEEYLKLGARMVDLHPLTLVQNARTAANGDIAIVPYQAMSVGPRETWKAEKVSIWHPGIHDSPFGMRLTALMIGKHVPDTSVPMSLLALHPNVEFHFYREAIGECRYEN
ncbi:MAG TPA: glucosamine-6-phosphate isomerase [Armatimonadota bacterium]|nr:glucosamine-6-phosphate isomerase [Armatimonadota bacterium]